MLRCRQCGADIKDEHCIVEGSLLFCSESCLGAHHVHRPKTLASEAANAFIRDAIEAAARKASRSQVVSCIQCWTPMPVARTKKDFLANPFCSEKCRRAYVFSQTQGNSKAETAQKQPWILLPSEIPEFQALTLKERRRIQRRCRGRGILTGRFWQELLGVIVLSLAVGVAVLIALSVLGVNEEYLEKIPRAISMLLSLGLSHFVSDRAAYPFILKELRKEGERSGKGVA